MTDTAMLEILASKICHDLISPIGAVNNGVELVTDLGADAGPEAIELISFSAQMASSKLQAFRLAYGVGGSDANIKVSDVHKTIQQIVGAEKKITQNWNPEANLGPLRDKRAFCKILTCVLLLAMECLPKGGKLIVASDAASVVVRAEGTDAILKGLAPDALKLSVAADKLQPQDVHAYMTGLMAKNYGFAIAYTPAAGTVDFKISAA